MTLRQSVRLPTDALAMGTHVNRLSVYLLLAALPFILMPSGHAATASGNTATNLSWYDVELVVFRYTDPQAGDMESWPADPGIPDWKTSMPLLTAATNPGGSSNALAGPTPFMQIDGHQLDGAWNRLKRSHDYEPLLHVAWVEPLADHATAASVQIGVPPPIPVATSNAGLAITPLPTQTTAAATVPTPVYGSVKFSQYGPYLHFDVDLVCQGPIAKNIMRVPAAASVALPVPATPGGAGVQWYRMTQDRRIEAGKLNYFDNPLFGVLVLVTPHPAQLAH